MATPEPPEPRIRPATPADAAACARIYAPYVAGTVATFEDRPPTADDLARRIRASHAWLVAEERGAVAGYAYGSTHRDRAAYRWAADVAVYVAGDRRGRGLGRALYGELLPLLRERGLLRVCAGVTLPNPASEALHRAAGFEVVGTYRRIGFKHGAWLDVRWFQLDLAPDDDGPPPGYG